MSGLTSQPSMGAICAAVEGTEQDTGIDPESISGMSDYWEQVRSHYAPFDCALSGLKTTSSDALRTEIPGGQYSNMHMQTVSLGLAGQWRQIKDAYAEANKICGDIIKVTPSSKVVGELAQFMVQNGIDRDNFMEKAENLSFPSSVVEFFQGHIGQPPFGFPEDIREAVLKGAPVLNGRPGATLEPIDWEALRASLEARHEITMTEVDLVSSVMYPRVFDEYMQFRKEYGDVSGLPTYCYFDAMVPGEDITVDMYGREVKIKFVAKSSTFPDGTRDVYFNVSGSPRTVNVIDMSTSRAKVKTHVKAEPGNPKQLGAPMQGNVVQVKVKVGDEVEKGTPLMILAAMKMETALTAPAGPYKIQSLPLAPGDYCEAGDLLVEFA